ncbi:MAG TPA: nitrilase-related carbon-nitrogen hydrolase [Bryobacteraceae bacterium]|nr:nitrilase-related carbon-nitrogen hydrolase [Bryobacteraceae bacterium]
MQNIKAAAVQFEPVQADKQANLAKIGAFAHQAAAANVQLLVFPECCITGYWFLRNLSRDELCALAEPVFTGPSAAVLRSLAIRYGMTIGAGLVEAGEDGRLYNSYLVAMPGGEMRRHRKLHAFENEHISSGSEFTVFDTPHGCRVGVLICYDVNIIENVHITALMGAEVLLAPHQTGGCRTRNPLLMGLIERDVWENRHRSPETIRREILGDKGRGWLMRWLPSRAHDNGLFLVFANGIGVDDDEIRTGNSMILDPYGRILNETQEPEEDMVVADLCASLLEDCTGRVWIQARRPDLYVPLTVPTGRERDVRALKFAE